MTDSFRRLWHGIKPEWFVEMTREEMFNEIGPARPDWNEAEVQGPVDKKRGYISGPMRGHPDLNHAMFDSVQKYLEDTGRWFVHSPAQTNRQHGHDEKTPYSEAIRHDVRSLLDSQAIILLPGWEVSEGARFEVQVAKNFDLEFYTIAEDYKGFWVLSGADPASLGVEGPDQEARRLVYGARAATYGHPRGDFECIGGIWASMIMAKVKFWAFTNGHELPDIPWFELINDELTATMMTGLKLARQVKSPQHRDSMVDIIGYQLCMARLHEDPSEMQAWQARSEAILAGASEETGDEPEVATVQQDGRTNDEPNPRFATGGVVPGFKRDDDSVPAALSPSETYVYDTADRQWHAGETYSHLESNGTRKPAIPTFAGPVEFEGAVDFDDSVGHGIYKGDPADDESAMLRVEAVHAQYRGKSLREGNVPETPAQARGQLRDLHASRIARFLEGRLTSDDASDDDDHRGR